MECDHDPDSRGGGDAARMVLVSEQVAKRSKDNDSQVHSRHIHFKRRPLDHPPATAAATADDATAAAYCCPLITTTTTTTRTRKTKGIN